MFFVTTLIAFLYEAYLAIPIVGGATVLATGYATVWVALVIHAIVLIVRMGTIQSKVVPIIAIFLTCFTWIPILGWGIHLCIVILYFIDLLLGKYSIRRL